MNRPCAFCGERHDFLAMPLIDSGADRRFTNYGYELRNDPHHSTVAERAGHVLAAKAIKRALPRTVRISSEVI